METVTGALSGLKVVEFAHVIAGPLAGTLMADLGATVVHVEDPGRGDPQRVAGPAKDGVHLWWKISARNKRSVTLNLRTDEGRDVARELAAWADVVITNFRVETLGEVGPRLGLPERDQPEIIVLQVPASARSHPPQRAGVRQGRRGDERRGQLTGFPDGPPVHTGFSHGDSVTGLMGAYAMTPRSIARTPTRTSPASGSTWPCSRGCSG